MKQEIVYLTDGTPARGYGFDMSDLPLFQNLFAQWTNLNSCLYLMGGRSVNVPDVLSEGLFCLAYNAVRTSATAHSYDCVMRDTHQGVQIKSTSIEKDLTSFGPKSSWDLLYFANFAPNGVVNGIVKFYRIADGDIYDLILNKKKNETFYDQQLQGRRPRFSIIDRIIIPNKIVPERTIDLNTGLITY